MPKYDFEIGDEIVEVTMKITEYAEYQVTGKIKNPKTGRWIKAKRVWGNENPPTLNFVGKWFANGKEY